MCIKALEIKEADTVVFCGVDFMAETAAILNPRKEVLIPDRGAKCPMAEMLQMEDIKKAKTRYPAAAVVLYVNTLAEAKAGHDMPRCRIKEKNVHSGYRTGHDHPSAAGKSR